MGVQHRVEPAYISSNNSQRLFNPNSNYKIIGIWVSYPENGNKMRIYALGPDPQTGMPDAWRVRWTFEGNANIGIDPAYFHIMEVPYYEYNEA